MLRPSCRGSRSDHRRRASLLETAAGLSPDQTERDGVTKLAVRKNKLANQWFTVPIARKARTL